MSTDAFYMRKALRLARRAVGQTSPNPMVGALLVKKGQIIGRGWHHRAGAAHAEVEALQDALARGNNPAGATLYVTLEPCSTQGRTPPCTEAIRGAGLRRVVVGATDPNPAHSGRAFALLKKAGITVVQGPCATEITRLNEAFNHWIVQRTPLVTVKAAMTLDGKIATATGESRWITGELARARAMKMRQAADAILVGINTVLADNPSLTVRLPSRRRPISTTPTGAPKRRIILDSLARTPLDSKLVTDDWRPWTIVVTTRSAPRQRRQTLAERVTVWIAPGRGRQIDLNWLLVRLGAEGVTSLLVEGGGEVNASFLMGGHAHRVAFFYAPKIIGGRNARKAVAGDGVASLGNALRLEEVKCRQLGPDWLMTAKVHPVNAVGPRPA